MVLQVIPVALEGLPDKVFICEGLIVRVSVESRKPRCFKCNEENHVRADCETRRNRASPQKESQNAEGERKPPEKQKQRTTKSTSKQ